MTRAMLTLPPTQGTPPQSQTQHEDNTRGEVDGHILSGRNGDETSLLPPPGAESAATIPTPVADSGRVGGVAIATCCHHACVWRDYTGREFLLGLVKLHCNGCVPQDAFVSAGNRDQHCFPHFTAQVPSVTNLRFVFSASCACLSSAATTS